MSISITLPQFLCTQLDEVGFEISDNSLQLNASSMQDLFALLKAKQPSVLEKIFQEDGSLQRNIILIADEKIISQPDASALKFSDIASLEFMFQFAGG